jgi:hypothetical protein
VHVWLRHLGQRYVHDCADSPPHLQSANRIFVAVRAPVKCIMGTVVLRGSLDRPVTVTTMTSMITDRHHGLPHDQQQATCLALALATPIPAFSCSHMCHGPSQRLRTPPAPKTSLTVGQECHGLTPVIELNCAAYTSCGKPGETHRPPAHCEHTLGFDFRVPTLVKTHRLSPLLKSAFWLGRSQSPLINPD